eukprot:UN00117
MLTRSHTPIIDKSYVNIHWTLSIFSFSSKM